MKQSLFNSDYLFEKYFPKPEEEINWMPNSFHKEFFQTVISLSIEEIENSIELSCDTT